RASIRSPARRPRPGRAWRRRRRMNETAPAVRYRTGPIWVVLSLLVLGGTVAAAFFVFGLADLFATGNWAWDVPLIGVAGVAATFLLLLVTGILYRIDRLRGVPHREVRLFE